MQQLTPEDLTLPPKFSEFRDGQFDAVMSLYDSSERVTLLNAPTGAGKSLIYISLSMFKRLCGEGHRTAVLVSTKALQRQLYEDFHECDCTLIMGKANYSCDKFSVSVKDAPCNGGFTCDLKPVCTYYSTISQAKQSNLVITNYAFWLSFHKYSSGLGDFDLLILDEGHNAPEILADFCSAKITDTELRRLGFRLPPTEGSRDDYRNWAQGVKDECSQYGSSDFKQRSRVRDLIGRLSTVVSMSDSDKQWVVERSKLYLNVSPVWASMFTEERLFLDSKKIVITSATVTSDTAKFLGVKKYNSIELKSNFAIRRRPFCHVDVMPRVRVDNKLKSKNGMIRLLVRRIDDLIEPRLTNGRKGIIHTRSYDWTRLFLSCSRFRESVITHDDSRQLNGAIARFRSSPEPKVLVSPSVWEGYDFAGDQCRWQVILKIPFVDGRDPVLKQRIKLDKSYGSWLASQCLVQMCGRSVRSGDDWSETFIFDDHWRWFKRVGIFPGWFRATWSVINRQPQVMTGN